jgi:hypothetical protein
MRPSDMGHPDLWESWLGGGFSGVGVGLDGADFDFGVFAGVGDAVAGDPYFAFAEHGSLVGDEEFFVLLVLDDGGDVGGDDVVVVFDEGLLVFDVGGLALEFDLDGVVDESGYGGGVVFGDGLLEVGDELVDAGVVSEDGVDGLVYILRAGGFGWVGGSVLREGGIGEDGCEDDEACELGSEFHFRLH